MKNHPKVSVIIPVYNHGPFVGKAIQSILDQTFQDFEIIVTNDGSTDNTREELEKINDSRLKVLNFERNRGMGMAMNNCILHASGEYIASLNADDVANPNRLEKQVEFLDQNLNVGAVFSYAGIIDDGGDYLEHPFKEIFRQQNKNRFEWLNYFFYNNNALCHPSAMLRMECYKKVGLYDPRFHQLQDLELWTRLCKEYEIYVIKEELVKFRILAGEKNTTANTADKISRSSWERAKILDHYLTIKEKDFLKVFPNIIERFEHVDFEFFPFYISNLALDRKLVSFQYFGINTLFDFLKNNEIVDSLEKLYDFNYSNFVKMDGTSDMFNILQLSEVEKMLKNINQEIELMQRSHFWKLRNVYIKYKKIISK